MKFSEIGDLTAEEIAMASQVKQNQQMEFFRMMAQVVYKGAELTGVMVNDSRKFPRIEDAFPGLFEKNEQQGWWVMKERVGDYAKRKNKSTKALKGGI